MARANRFDGDWSFEGAVGDGPCGGQKPIAVVSTFPPTRCGLATYAEDLIAALETVRSDTRILRVAVAAPGNRAPLPQDVVVRRGDTKGWEAVARRLEERGVGVLVVQHEFKIFGGVHGASILSLMESRPCPIVTTLHTVSRPVPGPRLEVLRRVCAASDLIVVHTSKSMDTLRRAGVNPAKIHVIPHGVPAVAFELPGDPKGPAPRRRPLFLSYGHLRESKGYELTIAALARLRRDGVPFEYWIYGKDHPRRKTAARYRARLVEQVREAGLGDRVQFVDEYLAAAELIRVVKACDAGLLPYRRLEQGSSGTLALFLACGRPVVASAFRAAREIVGLDCGRLFPVGDAAQLYEAVKTIATCSELRAGMMRSAHARAKAWRWEFVGRRYLKVMASAREDLRVGTTSFTGPG